MGVGGAALRVPLRVLVVGGLRDPGPWDLFGRLLGGELAKAGVAVSIPNGSGFGKAVVDGYLKAVAVPSPGWVRVHPGEAEAIPEALAPHHVPPLPEGVAGDAAAQALREADVVLLAGNGRGLPQLYDRAVGRRVPVVPLPIEQTTAEDLWERTLSSFPQAFVAADVRNAFLGLRRPDPRSQKTAGVLASVLVGVGRADDFPGGPRVLLVASEADESPSGEDGLAVLLRRALRGSARGARVQGIPRGWLHSPGKGFADAVRSADLTVVDLGSDAPGALYALGYARGAGRPVFAVARREGKLALDPQAIDAVLWGDERELAARLERRISQALRVEPSKSSAATGKGARKRGRPKRPGRGPGKRPAPAQGPAGGSAPGSAPGGSPQSKPAAGAPPPDGA